MVSLSRSKSSLPDLSEKHLLETRMPSLPITSGELIRAWLKEGWAYRAARKPQINEPPTKARYQAQAEHELGIIELKDFVDYFLFMSDIVRWAKDQGIVTGPCRGSGGSSVICWLLRITEVDPMDFPLMDFSRFIDETRDDMPDIDIDLDDVRRMELWPYAQRKYGMNCVGTVGTYTKFHGKSALTDVARVFDHINPGDVQIIKDLIADRQEGDDREDFGLTDTVANFEAAAAAMDRNPELKVALRIEGDYRSMSVHPAGMVVTNAPITDYVSLYSREKADGTKGFWVSVDKRNAEYLNLLKADFLGLSTMGMVGIALDLADLTLDTLYQVPLDDPATLEGFKKSDVVGIFQFEGRTTRMINRDIEPDTFMDVVDITALSRPGPLASGFTQDYIKVKAGTLEPQSFHPTYDKIVARQRGQIIYQEQVTAVLREFGCMESKAVQKIRKIIAKKLGGGAFQKYQEEFIQGAVSNHGVTPELAQEVWGRLVASAGYSFVHSHAVGYGIISFWAMWLKVNHPLAFYAAILQKAKKDRWPKLIRDAERHGVRVLGVEAGVSQSTWSIDSREPNTIIAGYEQLHGIGEKTSATIQQWLAEGNKINTADDMIRIKGIGVKTVENIRDSMESDDPFDLRRAERMLDAVRKSIQDGEIPLRYTRLSSNQVLEKEGNSKVLWLGIVKEKVYRDAIDMERAKTGQPREEIIAGMKDSHLSTSCTLKCYDDKDEEVYVKVNRFSYPKWRKPLDMIRPDEDVIYVEGKRSPLGFGASIKLEKLTVIDPE